MLETIKRHKWRIMFRYILPVMMIVTIVSVAWGLYCYHTPISQEEMTFQVEDFDVKTAFLSETIYKIHTIDGKILLLQDVEFRDITYLEKGVLYKLTTTTYKNERVSHVLEKDEK